MRIRIEVAEKLMQVRLAGLAGVDDRIVGQDLARPADEPERADYIGSIARGNPLRTEE